MKKKLGVVIATSMQRIESLFSLSLHSVLSQTILPECIVVVDDNIEDDICAQIECRVKRLNDSRVHYIRNNRTKNMSGTGAWNTGLEFLKNEIGEENYVAILDDDDSWDVEYIENLHNCFENNPDAVFAFLKRSDCPKPSSFAQDELQINNFLIGDPGIQGSNMCFKIKSIMTIGGFDENLASCTDRDLMIRFLHQYGNENSAIIPKKLVNHFSGTNTVTSNFEKKRAGLNYFFRKHIKRFDFPTLEQSLKRAEKLFQFPDAYEIKSIWKQNTIADNKNIIESQEIVIGVAMHNNAPTIRRCLLSILNQQGVTRKIKIVLANDNSSDNWQEEITDLLGDSRLTIIHLSNNNAVLTRNAINTYIQEHHPRCVLIGRLDADDEYSSDNELAKIEVIFDTECPDIISAGNYLRKNGMIISRTNHTDKRFANLDYLLFRLKQMAECLPEGELPSCNLFIKPGKTLPYPSVESGEDHALFVHYLLNKDSYKIHFAETLLPVIYDLGGKATSNNKFSGSYIRCRKELYLKALEYAR